MEEALRELRAAPDGEGVQLRARVGEEARAVIGDAAAPRDVELVRVWVRVRVGARVRARVGVRVGARVRLGARVRDEVSTVSSVDAHCWARACRERSESAGTLLGESIRLGFKG